MLFTACYDENFKVWKPFPYLQNLVQISLIRDNSFGLAVRQPVLKSVSAKKRKKRDRNSTGLIYGNMRNCGLRGLRQQDTYPVPCLYPLRLQAIGKPV